MPSSRFLAFYGLVSIGVLGALIPYLGSYMAGLGITGDSLGLLMAMFPIGRLIGAPIWGWIADRFQIAGWLVRLGTGLALLGVVGILLAKTPLEATIAVLILSIGRVPTGPLIDALILEALEREGRDMRDYGRVRFWGSGGFVGMAALCGWVGHAMELGLLLSALLFALSFVLPPKGEGGPAPVGPALRELAGEPGFLMVCGWSCMQALQISVYDTFYGVHLDSIGAPGWVLPASIAAGVGCELVVMGFSQRVLEVVGLRRAFVLSSMAGIPRWLVISFSKDPVLLAGAQALHGLSFALFWLAAVLWFAKAARKEIAASSQSLLISVSYGVGALGGAFLAGRLQEVWGSVGIFYGLTVVGGISTGLAVGAGRQAKA